MDAFDAVRRNAANLHDAAVARGARPCSPAELVAKAAEHLDIEVQAVPLGDATLQGALAIFDAQIRLVCYADEGGVADQALLIGHELGHAVLHAVASRCEQHDIDADVSIEQPPVGLERVTDYGARERRELHANVFARELVLPLSLARRLYLDEALTVDAIAARTGLSPTLVRQQVLDALLLPPPPDETEAPHAEHAPDSSQEVAARHSGSAYNLQAGPGTGKTRTLVERVKWLVTQGADPATILVVTFSNRAAGELSERFAAAIPEAATLIWTGTFHAFGLDLIRRFHDRLELSSDPRLFDRSDAIAALQEVLPTLPLQHYRNLWNPALSLRDILAGISRAKDEVTDSRRYRELASRMVAEAHDDAERVAAQKCCEVAEVYEHYERVLREQDAVDFGDLIMRPTLLLESDEGLRAQLSARHRHILVDEFQDVNRASARLLKAIAGNAERLWVVGDGRQSIYRFRGASPANLQSFHADFSGKAGQLAVNYRSTEQIVRTVCAVATKLKASEHQLPLELTARRGQGPAMPEIRSFDGPEAEAAGIAESICELETQGVPLHDQAVLCRSNARLGAIAAVLEARGVPVLHLGSLFERDDVRDLLALLSLAVDKFGAGLVRVGAIPRYGLSLQDVYIATKWLREADYRPLEGLAHCARDAIGLTEEGVAGLSLLAADLADLSQSQTPWEFLCTYLLDRTGELRALATETSIAGQMKGVAIWQFLNFVRAPTFGGTGSPVRRVLDRVRELVLLAEERSLREVPSGALHLNAVRLMTVHASKGLEFEAVHLPGLTAQSFPAQAQGQRCPPPRGMVDGPKHSSVTEQAKYDHDAEEECLFFVALSRAKTHARLYRYEKTAGGTNRNPSSFLAWLTAIGIHDTAHSGVRVSAGGSPGVIHVSAAQEQALGVAELTLYDRCPLRFFYTHVLKLGTARPPTAFLRTHDCIRALIDWYTDPQNAANATLTEVQRVFEELWDTRGPTDHGYAAEYHALAASLAEALVRIAPAGTTLERQPIAVTFSTGNVKVEPDQIGRRPDGRTVIRRLNTGKKRVTEYDRLEYAAYRLAADQCGALLEAVFLTTGSCEPVDITSKKLSNRRETIEKLLGKLRAGEFTAKPEPVMCAGCPHFFVCDVVPAGALSLD